jgi:hypothetical protein
VTRDKLIAQYTTAGHIAFAEIERLAQKSAETDPAKFVGSVMDAVLPEFSRDVPRRYQQTIEAASSPSNLEKWGEDSELQSCEYPTGQYPREMISLSGVYVDDEGATPTVYVTTVPVGANYVLTYTAVHELPATGDITVPASKYEAFFLLTSARLADMLAADYAPAIQPGYGESVSYRTQSGEWRAMAKAFRTRYREVVGVPEGPRVRAAEVSVAYEQPEHRSFSTDTEVWP